uniref:Uncharacterized protein n=1 Tax=Vespula pensylvanica TaxID=30213 RepID=A0A834UAE5_VESPE|nr:hypothetical protein H0235_008060 [Vespula pensylvanica]
MNIAREGNKKGIVIPPQGHCRRDKESTIGEVHSADQRAKSPPSSGILRKVHWEEISLFIGTQSAESLKCGPYSLVSISLHFLRMEGSSVERGLDTIALARDLFKKLLHALLSTEIRAQLLFRMSLSNVPKPPLKKIQLDDRRTWSYKSEAANNQYRSDKTKTNTSCDCNYHHLYLNTPATIDN